MSDEREFSASVWQEGEWWVAQALEVDVASQGETLDIALDNLGEALALHFEHPSRWPVAEGGNLSGGGVALEGCCR